VRFCTTIGIKFSNGTVTLYEDFYKLKENPFRLTPDPSFLYMTSSHREALAGLVYSACNRVGLTVLIGEAGTGKTTLLNCFRAWLQKRQFVIGVYTNPTLTREEFFDYLLVQLGVACSSSLKSRQLLALHDRLSTVRAEGHRSVLLVDEAQRLSPELLEEIRLLLNLETPREKLLEIIIAGQPELADTLRRPELRQLKQRVSCFCRIEGLSRDEVKEYVQHRMAQAGLPGQKVFIDDTIDLIYEYTQGIPRLVNSLCDSALRSGFALQSARMTVDIVSEAAKDLDLVRDDFVKKTVTADGRTTIPEVAVPSFRPAVPIRAVNCHDAHSTSSKAPLEAYATRQKSVGFFAGLMDRLK
jgi:general secretion pathway protein A